MTDSEPTYDRVNIREVETHHVSNESIKMGNVATFQFERDKEIQKLIRVFIVVFTIFAVLLIVALIVIIMLLTERPSYTTPNVEYLQSVKCPQDELNVPIPPQTRLKVYIDQQLKKQRRYVHQLSLRIDAHLFAPKEDNGDKTSNVTTTSKLKNCCNFKDDIVGLKLANISLGHKLSANTINVEANRNKLSFLTKHVDLLNNDLNEFKNSAVQNDILRDISNLKVANLTMFSINYMNSIVMDKLTNEMNMVEARLTSLQNVLSSFSLKKIEHDLHMLKTSNLTLHNHISKTSNDIAKIDNKLVLLTSQVNVNKADNALLKTLKDGAIQKKEIELVLSRLDEYNKKLQILASKLAQMNSTGLKDNKKDLLIRKELGYCTINVPITACLPCSCIANDILYNKYSCDCSNLPLKKDCRDYYENGYRVDGIYTILPKNHSTKIRVFCEHSNGGGWMVIQRRKNANVGFYRNWKQYKDGFGDLSGSHYIGNEYISKLTHNVKHELRIELMSHTKNSFFAGYDDFSIKDEKSGYQLECSGYKGNAGDSFCSYHSGSKFSTLDTDNDEWGMGSCAENYRGGWWYKNCAHSNLNSHYYPTSSVCPIYTGMHWYSIGQSYSSLKETKMLIRRV